MSLTLVDFFCGAGGSSQGAVAVPGVEARLAANHWAKAIESHAANFPDTEHFRGDLHDADVARFPAGDLFWASPECPQWSQARGKQRDFDKQPDMFGETLVDEAADRSRSLMWDVPRYLEAMKGRGRPVLAGVVENVTEVRKWTHWHDWVGAIQKLGYKTRLIALNSMHAQAQRTLGAPQSRDRLYLAYWLADLGRDPDWDRWLRPQAWCPECGEVVAAVQWWKRPGSDMGRYRQQYLYRCPHMSCRNTIVEPPALPAAAAIDWSDLGTRIGDRPRPMSTATRERIAAGLKRYARPITLEAAGHTFERTPGVRTWPADWPITAQTASMTKGLACPPMIVPAGGTWREAATSAGDPMSARTTRENDGLAVPPFLVPLRSGRPRTIPVSDPTATVVADGSGHGVRCAAVHHGPPWRTWRCPDLGCRRSCVVRDGFSIVSWAHLLVPYYGNATGRSRPVMEPAGTLSTRDRFGLASGSPEIAVDDVLFRMLKPLEIGRAMAFADGYVVIGTQRERVRQYGNAVTPPVAEVIFSALVEAITGGQLERAA